MWRERFKNWKAEHVREENRGGATYDKQKSNYSNILFLKLLRSWWLFYFSIEGQMHLSDSSKRGGGKNKIK